MRVNTRTELNPWTEQGCRSHRPTPAASTRLDLLKRLLAVPSQSLQEEQVVAFITDYVNESEGRRGRCWSDEHNNVYIVKGQAEHYPCLAAHIDTVHPLRPVRIVDENGILVGYDHDGERSGIGADDKAGVFTCLELLQRFDNLAVALFAAEEIGCRGAYSADAAFFQKVGYALEFDAPGHGLVSYTSGGVRLFQHDGEFIQRALPVLSRHGLTNWQRHPFTDVMALRERFTFSCLNLSCGYHNWRTQHEYLRLDDVNAAVEMGAALVEALGERRYDFIASQPEATEPPSPVTSLWPTESTPCSCLRA